jgi:hypothetical protein
MIWIEEEVSQTMRERYNVLVGEPLRGACIASFLGDKAEESAEAFVLGLTPAMLKKVPEVESTRQVTVLENKINPFTGRMVSRNVFLPLMRQSWKK